VYVFSTNLCRFDSKLALLKKIIFLYCSLLFFTGAFSQAVPDSMAVNVDSIVNTKHIEAQTYVFFDSAVADHTPFAKVSSELFVPLTGFSYKKSIRAKLVTKSLYLSFRLYNGGNTERSFYFFPGSLYAKTNIYKKNNGVFEPFDSAGARDGYLFLTLQPGERSLYMVELGFCKTNFNRISSTLITPDYLPIFKLELDQSANDKRSIGLILSGVLLMMILFTLVNYFLSGKLEFLFNCLYSICMFLLIFLTAYLTKDAGWFKVFFIGYFDLFLLVIGTIFYLAFTRKFLSTKSEFRALDRFLIAEEWILSVLMGIYTILYYFTDQFILQDMLENLIKVVILIAALIYIGVTLYRKNRLMNYLAIGTAVQIFLSTFSLLLLLVKVRMINIFTSPIFYFETGVIISVVFFLLGLTYKNRRELIDKIKEQEAMKLEVEKKGFETQLAVINAQQEERNRISADMHDDLGAGMTTIRLYSELAKNKIGNIPIPEIEKISNSADELLIKMNAIIWSMSSSNDSLGNMVAYIRSYALEYFEDTNIVCKISIPESLPRMEVSGEIRRNIFLVVKEALHNIVKHSGATEVNIVMEKKPKGLGLRIHDNGKGFDLENVRMFGNGLKNMKKRMEAISVAFSITNENGTVISLYRQTID
jgi:signal transduction histidine kinase